MFSVAQHNTTRGHLWKLYSNYCRFNLRKRYYSERVLAPWNDLKITEDTLHYTATFKSLAKRFKLSSFLHYTQ